MVTLGDIGVIGVNWGIVIIRDIKDIMILGMLWTNITMLQLCRLEFLDIGEIGTLMTNIK